MRISCFLACLTIGFIACMRSEPVQFSTSLLNFEVTSVLNQKNNSGYSFDLYIGVSNSYGPNGTDAISWALGVSDGISGERILSDSNKFTGSFYQRSYTFPSDKYPVNKSDSNHFVIITFKFYEHGKEFRSDTLHALLFVDSNQYVDSNFMNVIGNYTEDRSPMFYYSTCQVHNNSFYYDYRMKDSVINIGGKKSPGYFAAMRVSNPDSTYISRNWYVRRRRTFADTGDVPHGFWYSGDMGFKGDAPIFEMWVIYGKNFYHEKTVCE